MITYYHKRAMGWLPDYPDFRDYTEETEEICNRLLDEGVIMQPTGDFQNVLKIKPPLCVSTADADFFVNALNRVLNAMNN